MRSYIIPYKKGFVEMVRDYHDCDEYIQGQISLLDAAVSEVEAIWGAGGLLKRASKDMQGKWQRQMEKLADAIERRDVSAVPVLISGSIRGLKAMEEEVKASGFIPPVLKETWFIDIQGKQVAICQSLEQASLLQTKEHDMEIWTLEEVARFMLAYSNIGCNSEEQPSLYDALCFDFYKGDEVPF